MISFFNVKNPSVTIFLFVYVVILNLVLFIDPGFFLVPQPLAPFSELFFFITETLFGNNHYVLAILTIILLFVQSLMLNSLVNNAKLFDSTTFVPAIIYITVACLFREFLFFSSALLSVTFIIPAMGKSLRFFRRQYCYAEIFDMGFLIGIASLFYRPAFILIILLFVALLVMRAFNWREWVIGMSGFLTIFFLTGTFYFMADKFSSFVAEFLFSPAIIPRTHFASRLSLQFVGGFTVILGVFASFTFLLNYLKSAVLARKFLVLAVWSFVLMTLSCLLDGMITLHNFVILSVPLSIVICYLFMNIKRRRIANIIHFLWLAAVLFFQYYRA